MLRKFAIIATLVLSVVFIIQFQNIKNTKYTHRHHKVEKSPRDFNDWLQ